MRALGKIMGGKIMANDKDMREPDIRWVWERRQNHGDLHPVADDSRFTESWITES